MYIGNISLNFPYTVLNLEMILKLISPIESLLVAMNIVLIGYVVSYTFMLTMSLINLDNKIFSLSNTTILEELMLQISYSFLFACSLYWYISIPLIINQGINCQQRIKNKLVKLSNIKDYDVQLLDDIGYLGFRNRKQRKTDFFDLSPEQQRETVDDWIGISNPSSFPLQKLFWYILPFAIIGLLVIMDIGYLFLPTR